MTHNLLTIVSQPFIFVFPYIDEAQPKRGYQSTDDAGGIPFDEIAAEFGFAGPAGAKDAVEKALGKILCLFLI